MAFLTIRNVAIKGVAACVPKNIEENLAIQNISIGDINKIIKTTGIERRHVVDAITCTSDLCFYAAEKLIEELNWDRNEIEGLIFVSQSPDYLLPATSPILQSRLSLPTNCFTLDISLGCSGYIHGLSTLASYMQGGTVKKALLLVGDTSSITSSKGDKSTFPLFGDAGTATALAYKYGAEGMRFSLSSDGSGYRAIMIPHGGYRAKFQKESLEYTEFAEGISRNSLHLSLDGMDVFSFGISKAPESVAELLTTFDINKEDVNYFYFHQANMMMNERIRKKLQLPESKVPYSLKDFGNTSSASIPLTMVVETGAALRTGVNNIVACGFGVGLSWGTLYCMTENLVIPDLILYE